MELVRIDQPDATILPGLAAPFHAAWLVETGQTGILLEAIEAGQLEFSTRKYEFNNAAAVVKGRAWPQQAIEAGGTIDPLHRAKTLATLDEAVQQAQNFGRWLLLADALLARAQWLAFFGEPEELRRDANQCREISRAHGFALHQADLDLAETEGALRRRDRAEAAKPLKEAARLVRKHGYKLRYPLLAKCERRLTATSNR